VVAVARRLRIRVDYHRCVGSSICVLTAPGVFALNEGGQSAVVDPAGEGVDKILEAAEGCPTVAITVEDEESGERLFP